MVGHWLLSRVPGFAQLEPGELSAISDFTLLWTLFEARILNTAGSAATICAKVDAWEKAGLLDAAAFDPELSYFRQRYFHQGAFTPHFDGLQLRANDRGPLVRAVLDETNNEPQHRVACVLIIVLRYRNNLFHGVKWQYRLAGQQENFTAANSILMKALDRYGALDHG